MTLRGPIITAPGSYQSELGCAADWSPACMRPWLQDPDGDGTYTWSTDQIPAGSYEFKVAHGLSWDESYGDGGNNVALSVPSDGTVVTISYVLAHPPDQREDLTGGIRAGPEQGQGGLGGQGPRGLARDVGPRRDRPRASRGGGCTGRSTGGLAVDAEAVTGGPSASLQYDAAGLPAAVVAAHPELKGYLALRLSRSTARQAADILRGQVAVGMYDTLGRLTDATGVQVAGVLDDLYARSASRGSYGVTWRSARPTFSLWAPTAQSVSLLRWPSTASGSAPVGEATRVPMRRGADGAWSVPGSASWRGARYLYEVRVFAPTTGKVETNLVTDPYSVALTLNSTRSVAVDLADPSLEPAPWRAAKSPALKQDVDSSIYELHVRDFSVSDPTVPAAHRGSYLAFADDGDGTKHLKALAAAGLNTVHLLPTFDIASIEEDPAKQAEPACDLASYAPDSQEQQKCVTATAGKDAYNWGYDPFHWMAPEGSYASSARAADGGSRVAEFRTMVGALHRDGLRVVLDQVFNHTPASGQADTSVLDKVVPGYYQRLDASGAVQTSTCCQNVATEHAMAQKIMVDSVVSWARNYKVDGFRFDLMGHHSKANMLAVRAALDRLTPARGRRGRDARSTCTARAGTSARWPTTPCSPRPPRATSAARASARSRTGCATPSAVAARSTTTRASRASAAASRPTPTAPRSTRAAAASLGHDTDLVQLGLAGNLRAFTFKDSAGATVRGDQVDYNGAPAGYADQPDEVVSYVDAHDNETIWDSLTMKLPVSTSMADRVRMNTMSLATTALAQTPSFWHAGADLLRSKSLDRNSYDSGDWFNRLDWTGTDNGFGHGLPPEADNGAKWPFMKPLLANAALKPPAGRRAGCHGPGAGAAAAAVLLAAVPARVGARHHRQGRLPRLRDGRRAPGRGGDARGRHRRAGRRPDS